jgi:benzoyl-CoA reductase/2-hydroxyglutaryl-CoA dehydratase subunit BcrC/BadD/HgdB
MDSIRTNTKLDIYRNLLGGFQVLLQSQAYKTLYQAYQHRDKVALQWKQKGIQFVGCFGTDVPEEVLIAGDILPVRVFGNPDRRVEIADQYLEKGFDPYTVSQFDQIVNGAYSYLDRLVISNSSDAIIRVYYYLRALRKVESKNQVPPLYFFDFLHTPFRMSGMYNRNRLNAFIREVEAWSGKEITNQKLEYAINLCNETRKLLHELMELRDSETPRISGTQALHIIGSSMVMPREEYNPLLKQLINEIKEAPVLEGTPIFVTGSAQDHPYLYEWIESNGGVVVGEDHEMGIRHVQGFIDTQAEPVDGIVDRYHLRPPLSGQATVTQRVDSLIGQVNKTKAKAVVFYVYEKHDAISWDYPSQRKALEAQGISVLLLEDQPYGPITEESKRMVSEFIVSMKRRVNIR